MITVEGRLVLYGGMMLVNTAPVGSTVPKFTRLGVCKLLFDTVLDTDA